MHIYTYFKLAAFQAFFITFSVLPMSKVCTAQTEFMEAVIQEDVEKLQSILKAHTIDVNIPAENGKTALLLAVEGGNEKLVGVLLEARADVHAIWKDPRLGSKESHFQQLKALGQIKNLGIKDPRGIIIISHCTALLAAVVRENEAIVRQLIRAGAQVNQQGPHRENPLQVASLSGNVAIAQILLDAGADVNITDDNATTPIMAASSAGYLPMVELLLSRGGDINSLDMYGGTALDAATRGENIHTVTFLLEHEPKLITPTGDKIMAFEYTKGHKKIKRILDNAFARRCLVCNVSTNNNMKKHFKCTPNQLPVLGNALTRAAEKGNLAEVRQLIKEGVLVDQPAEGGYTALMFAAQNNDLAMVDELLSHGANPDSEVTRSKSTALFFAAQKGHSKIVERLIAAGASVHHQDILFGLTPLIIASQEGHEAIVAQLLNAHANPNKSSANGTSPLMYASQYGHLGIVITLLASAAKINATSADGVSALLLAAENGWLDTVRLLVERGALIETRATSLGLTPLLSAAGQGWHEVVRFLLKAGADISAKTCQKASALELAVMYNHLLTVQELLSHGIALETSQGQRVLAYQTAQSTVTSQLLEKAFQEKCTVCSLSNGKTCRGCHTTYYCSKECQLKAWPTHKKECKQIQAEKAKVQASEVPLETVIL